MGNWHTLNAWGPPRTKESLTACAAGEQVVLLLTDTRRSGKLKPHEKETSNTF